MRGQVPRRGAHLVARLAPRLPACAGAVVAHRATTPAIAAPDGSVANVLPHGANAYALIPVVPKNSAASARAVRTGVRVPRSAAAAAPARASARAGGRGAGSTHVRGDSRRA